MAAKAVEAWDERWATPEGRADWLMPRPAVAALLPVLKARAARSTSVAALDEKLMMRPPSRRRLAASRGVLNVPYR